MKEAIPDAKPIVLDGDPAKSVQAWNMMDGKIEWSAVNDIAEYLEVVDIEFFIDGLLLIKEYMAASADG